MAAQVGLTIVKRMTYRGNAAEEWSNQYWFTGAVPASSAAWKTLADALIAQEKAMYHSGSAVVRAYGYDSDSDDAVAVWSYDYLAAAASVPGSLTVGTGIISAGDQSGWIRWKTSRLNSRGKAIYLRKYFHSCLTAVPSTTVSDAMYSGWLTSAGLVGAKLRDGSFLDARTLTARGHTDVLTANGASAYVTTRTLKRRGKRPNS